MSEERNSLEKSENVVWQRNAEKMLFAEQGVNIYELL